MGSKKSKLWDRVECKDIEGVGKILKKHPDYVNGAFFKNCVYTPLTRAIWRQDFAMVKFLVSQNANVNEVASGGLPPASQAAQKNFIQIVKFLGENGVDFSVEDEDGYNALDHAITHGNYDFALYVKQKGNIEPKELGFYEQKRKMFVMKEVNFEDFLKNLRNSNQQFDGQIIQTSHTIVERNKKYDDPVLDPRETWTQAIDRVVNFKDPKIVSEDYIGLLVD